MSNSKLSLKLLIDQEANKVLFGEADKNTIDFLFSILTLPVATVINLLSKQGVVGSLANLYQSVESLSEVYMQNDQQKDTLLKPKVLPSLQGSPMFLLTDRGEPKERKIEKTYYRCSNRPSRIYYCDSEYSTPHHYVTDDPENVCPECNGFMNTVIPFVLKEKEVVKVEEGGGGFVKSVVTYMVMDDLVVKPISTISSVSLLTKFNVKDMGALVEKEVDLDINMVSILSSYYPVPER